MPDKEKWVPDEGTVSVIEKYGHLMNNTGGNEPLELLRRLNDDDRLMSTNIVVATLAMGIHAQVQLLKTLEKNGLLT